jgi:hypothetical protein
LFTANLLAPATCKSINSELAALAVSVIFSKMPVNVTAELFHVCVPVNAGIDIVVNDPLTAFTYFAFA